MDLMRNVLKNDIDELNEREVQLRIIGDRSRFDARPAGAHGRCGSTTAHNDRMQLNIAANFGGRWDITEAARALAKDVQAGRLDPDAIDEATFGNYLSLGDSERPGPLHPHRRRPQDQQFPALGSCLHGIVLHGCVLA